LHFATKKAFFSHQIGKGCENPYLCKKNNVTA
jgi:hypothetical protein